MKQLVTTFALSACMVCATVGFGQSSSAGAGKEDQQGTTMNGTGDSSAKTDNMHNGKMKKHHHKKNMSSDSSTSNGSGSTSNGSTSSGSDTMPK